MTTATADKVDLAAQNGAPKRRGRPPGSKNKPKADATVTTPRKRGRPRKATATKATPRKASPRKATVRRTRAVAVEPTTVRSTNHRASAVVIENDGLLVINSDGSSYTVTATVVVDRRK